MHAEPTEHDLLVEWGCFGSFSSSSSFFCSSSLLFLCFFSWFGGVLQKKKKELGLLHLLVVFIQCCGVAAVPVGV
jgi:hypothetical protein